MDLADDGHVLRRSIRVTPCYHTGDVMPLIPALAVGAFVWAARKEQFDDLTTPGMRVLHDDDEKPEEENREG